MELFTALARSRFRSGFTLSAGDIAYVQSRGMQCIAEHARRFVIERLAPARPPNDGGQTPWKGHPVFVAQHATAACCRGCLAKWHRIEKGRPLGDAEIDYVVDVICTWLQRQTATAGAAEDVEKTREPTLF